MPADTTALNAAVAALTTQVAKTEGTEASAKALITGFSVAITKAVTDALTADEAATQTSIDAANAAIATVTALLFLMQIATAQTSPPPRAVGWRRANQPG